MKFFQLITHQYLIEVHDISSVRFYREFIFILFYFLEMKMNWRFEILIKIYQYII